MPIEITMPRLSDTMEKGTIIKWHIAEGDNVTAGDVLADVETDKATMEMQAFDDGRVSRIAVDEGVAVAVGTVVAVIVEEDDDPAATASPEPVASPVEPSAPTNDPVATPYRKVTSVARRLAEQHGVDLSGLEGSGPGGRIIKRDVLAAVGT
ncbi:MAG: biotin/lipoyl-containing protein, partial [Phycisphaerales bacterium]|nr:biotin/lipoyl-containing protein [Phycisphaerales bacterium]